MTATAVMTPKTKPPVVMVAGNHSQYECFITNLARRRPDMAAAGNLRQEIPLLTKPQQILGRRPMGYVWCQGTWYENEQARQIVDAAEKLGWEVMDAPNVGCQ